MTVRYVYGILPLVAALCADKNDVHFLTILLTFSSDLVLVMAPEKDVNKKTARYVKELVLSKHCKKGYVPPNFTSLHSCERNFGFKYQIHTLCVGDCVVVWWCVVWGYKIDLF